MGIMNVSTHRSGGGVKRELNSLFNTRKIHCNCRSIGDKGIVQSNAKLIDYFMQIICSNPTILDNCLAQVIYLGLR